MSKKQDTMVWKPYGRKKENIKKVKEHARKYSYSESEEKKKTLHQKRGGIQGENNKLKHKVGSCTSRTRRHTYTYVRLYIYIYKYIHCK